MIKIVIILIVVVLLVFYLFPQKRLNNKKTEISQAKNYQAEKKLVINYHPDKDDFIIPIGTTLDYVEFKESGKVKLELWNSKQVFDITELHQQHRLYDLNKLFRMMSK